MRRGSREKTRKESTIADDLRGSHADEGNEAVWRRGMDDPVIRGRRVYFTGNVVTARNASHYVRQSDQCVRRQRCRYFPSPVSTIRSFIRMGWSGSSSALLARECEVGRAASLLRESESSRSSYGLEFTTSIR